MVTYEYIGSRVAQRNHDLNSTSEIDYLPTYDNLGRITSANSGTSYAKFDYIHHANTNNIYTQIYDHRTSPSNDPYTTFTYDDLSRLTKAVYGIHSDEDEEFTIDDLGNRDYVDLRSGNEDYVIDNATNQYTTIGGNSLTYDYAGNLTTDKDAYEYEYDYENRLIEITKNNGNTVVAMFAYDALSRRIRKIDSVASATTLYYYNPNWQVLAEYNGSTLLRWYAYGNYIDEVLFMGTTSSPITQKKSQCQQRQPALI